MAIPDLRQTAHRPWPLPRGPWVLHMRWHDLAFLHWPVPADELRPHIPERLDVDSFEGTAWLGVVPFRMSGVRPRCTPVVPGVSAFPELNLRTYVSAEGKPGVWFFSLDVTSRLAVRLARSWFYLPYFVACMKMEEVDGEIRYSSARVASGTGGEFACSYGARGSPHRSDPGSLEAWLTERYCLYSADRKGRVYRGEIHHSPWPLQPAEASVTSNTLATSLGVTLPSEPPLVHFARELDVVAWPLRAVD